MMVLRKRMTFKVGGRASIHREGAPETQSSWGNPLPEMLPSPPDRLSFWGRGMKRKPVILYGPTGDFNSIVKCMKVKLRYTSVDSESRFCMFRHFGYFLTLSLSLYFFFTKVFPRLVHWIWICTLYWTKLPHVNTVLYFSSKGYSKDCQDIFFRVF